VTVERGAFSIQPLSTKRNASKYDLNGMLPNFIIIGATKCGTTSLYHYLRQHPFVFMSTPKEPEFFLGKGRFSIREQYEALFDGVNGESAVGEASVGYFHSPEACARLKDLLPDARLIAVLRDPADRAYSHYNMLVAHGAIPDRPYLDVLKEARHTGDYQNTGVPTSRYATSLRRYFEAFGQENVCVYFFHDFKSDATATARSIFDHIGVDSGFEPDTTHRHNEGRRPRSDWLHRLIWSKSIVKDAVKFVLPDVLRQQISRAMHQFNRAPVPPLSEEARRIIIERLSDDIEQTEELLGEDLSAWKK
jgi:hypothetical protein